MALHAIDDLDDAFEATTAFLLPFRLRRWLKLAVVVFFVGGGTNLSAPGFDAGVPAEQPPSQPLPVSPPENVLAIAVALVVAVVVLALALALVSAIMEFVFVESLRHETVSLREYWSGRWRQGLRLFGFRIAIGLPLLALLLAGIAFVFLPMVTGVGGAALPLVALLVGVPLFFAFALVYGLINGFTTVFVVPIMVLEDCGVLAGWRRLWDSLRTAWKQYLAYLVVSVLLTFAAGILSSIVVGLVAVVVLIPLVLVGVLLQVTVSLSSTIGLVGLALLVLVFVITLLVVGMFVQVPIVTYLRYYALLVLGDVDASLDLIPDRRDAIRGAPASESSAE